MKQREKTLIILMAEDDPDDRLLSKEALNETLLPHELRFVEDGEELLDYLSHTGKYKSGANAPRPAVILLDLNMPKKDGREALEIIKANPGLRRIPVIVLTTSKADEDIFHSYNLGVSGYITKPSSLNELVDIMETLGKYWFETVELPPQ
jgi:CheY-like chemotaxis protein